jgi:hypothetical protein
MERDAVIELMAVIESAVWRVPSRASSSVLGVRSLEKTKATLETRAIGEGVVLEIWAGAERKRRRRMTGKRLGEIAEATFVAKAAELGFSVAKPWGDSDPYDFITQSGGKLCRVQVKSAHRSGKDGCYSFRAHNHALRAYQANEIDSLVANVVPENAWYVLPVEAVKKLRSLKLYPGSRRKRSKYEKYREAWEELRGR